MNYYEHHIGDYDANTSHLSWAEDMAYTRLIRWYYRKEKPIPSSLPEACRQIRAATRDQKAAVEAVLNEFFELRDDGWHQDRCDQLIAAYQAGEPERDAKKANEDNRMKRHREERAELFKVLTAAGQHAAWNIGIKELRELIKALPATAPATPATATQYPIPSTHNPSSYSVPNGTGGKPPLITDPEEIIFVYGLSLLVNAGTAEKQARSFLGGLRKHHGDTALIDKLRECAKAKVLQPLEWLAAALPPGGSTTKPNAQEALEASNRSIVEKLLAKEAACVAE